MSKRAENLDDVLKGKSIGAPRLGLVVKGEGKPVKPLPDLDEKERPAGYVGQRRRGGRD